MLLNFQSKKFKVEHFIKSEKTWYVAELSKQVPSHIVAKIYAVPIPLTVQEDSFY